MNAKLLIIILGGLIVLFFVGTSWGVLSDDQSVGGVAEAVVNMVRGLQKDEPLDASDVMDADPADCRELFRREEYTLDGRQACRLVVDESSVPVRTLTLRHQHGNPVELEMRMGDDEDMDPEMLPVEDEEGQEKHEIELQFVPDGGRLTITCKRTGGPNQCVLAVVSP